MNFQPVFASEADEFSCSGAKIRDLVWSRDEPSINGSGDKLSEKLKHFCNGVKV